MKLGERKKNLHYGNYLASIGRDGEEEFVGACVATGEAPDSFFFVGFMLRARGGWECILVPERFDPGLQLPAAP